MTRSIDNFSPPGLDDIIEVSAEIKKVENELLDLEARRAEAQARLRALRGKLARHVLDARVPAPEDTEAPSADEEPASRAKPMAEQIREWFEANPDAVARAADLVKAGIDASTDSVRSTLHRLEGEGFLSKPGTGRYMLKKKDGRSAA